MGKKIFKKFLMQKRISKVNQEDSKD